MSSMLRKMQRANGTWRRRETNERPTQPRALRGPAQQSSALEIHRAIRQSAATEGPVPNLAGAMRGLRRGSARGA